MVLAGALPPVRGLILLPAQLLGCMVAGALVSAMFPGDIADVNTTLSPGTSITQGVFIEMFLTCLLIFIVLMLAAEKSKDTFMAPIGIGLALFVAEIAGTSSCILHSLATVKNVPDCMQVCTILVALSTLLAASAVPSPLGTSLAITGSIGSARSSVPSLQLATSALSRP